MRKPSGTTVGRQSKWSLRLLGCRSSREGKHGTWNMQQLVMFSTARTEREMNPGAQLVSQEAAYISRQVP